MRKYILILTVFLGLGLVTPAFADDKTYSFSDDFSSSYNLDRSQTYAKVSGGRVYAADLSPSSSVESGTIDNPSRAIIRAELDVNQYVPSGTAIIYYLSNTDGNNWTQVSPFSMYTFPVLGNQLRWKAVIARNDIHQDSAYIESINLIYVVSDSVYPTQQNSSGSQTSYQGGTASILSNFSNQGVNSLVCRALTIIGLGCSNTRPNYTTTVSTDIFSYGSSTPAPSSAAKSAPANSSGSNLEAAIITATRKVNGSDEEVILVRVPGQKEIYKIIKGQKHLIPNMEIFYNYGYALNMVNDITAKELARYPRAKVAAVIGNTKQLYYLTEGAIVRPILNQKVADSYGDRPEDVITISALEYNYYPRDRFVFLERPLENDVYELIGSTKRYVTPYALEKMRVSDDQIAPINQTELDTYSSGQPIVY